MTLKELDEQIENIEGEIMLAAFHGYRLPAFEERLLELLTQRENYEGRTVN